MLMTTRLGITCLVGFTGRVVKKHLWTVRGQGGSLQAQGPKSRCTKLVTWAVRELQSPWPNEPFVSCCFSAILDRRPKWLLPHIFGGIVNSGPSSGLHRGKAMCRFGRYLCGLGLVVVFGTWSVVSVRNIEDGCDKNLWNTKVPPLISINQQPRLNGRRYSS
jgi:hypothetical protein